jgi:hypothetical protein
MRYRSTPMTLAPRLNRRCDRDHKNAVCRCIVHIRESQIDRAKSVIGRTVQMMVWRILAETHSLTTSPGVFFAGITRLFCLAQTVSAPRHLGCKRVIRIAGIHKIRTRGAQQFFDLLDRLPNHAARLAGLNLAF